MSSDGIVEVVCPNCGQCHKFSSPLATLGLARERCTCGLPFAQVFNQFESQPPLDYVQAWCQNCQQYYGAYLNDMDRVVEGGGKKALLFICQVCNVKQAVVIPEILPVGYATFQPVLEYPELDLVNLQNLSLEQFQERLSWIMIDYFQRGGTKLVPMRPRRGWSPENLPGLSSEEAEHIRAQALFGPVPDPRHFFQRKGSEFGGILLNNPKDQPRRGKAGRGGK